jgi:hypothetical protein
MERGIFTIFRRGKHLPMTTQMEAVPMPWNMRITMRRGKPPSPIEGGIAMVAKELRMP